MTIFTIIIFALSTGLAYAVLLLLTKVAQSFKAANVTAGKRTKLVLLIASIATAILITYFFLFTSPATNFTTAYISQEQQGYKVIIKGKRVYMVHDPVSVFLRKTYEDSTQFIIPRSDGIITGQELPAKKGHYKSVGEIFIKDRHLKINLYTDNQHDKTIDPNTWNGNYELVWRQ